MNDYDDYEEKEQLAREKEQEKIFELGYKAGINAAKKDVVLIVYLDTILVWTRAALERMPESEVLKDIEQKIIVLREAEEMK